MDIGIIISIQYKKYPAQTIYAKNVTVHQNLIYGIFKIYLDVFYF